MMRSLLFRIRKIVNRDNLGFPKLRAKVELENEDGDIVALKATDTKFAADYKTVGVFWCTCFVMLVHVCMHKYVHTLQID